jgi:hypothetical protein
MNELSGWDGFFKRKDPEELGIFPGIFKKRRGGI